MDKHFDNIHSITFSGYELCNLQSTIEAAGYGAYGQPWWTTNPLQVIHTGDWLGRIYYKITQCEYEYRPNKLPGALVTEANQFQMRPLDG